jgi:hypothetical protein
MNRQAEYRGGSGVSRTKSAAKLPVRMSSHQHRQGDQRPDLRLVGRYCSTWSSQAVIRFGRPTGLTRFVQENLLVQNRGDVTVNAQLRIGNVNEAINVVSEAPAAVQFNTSSMDLTVDNTMVRNLPVIGRNPFTMTLLDPAVVNRYTTAEKTPFKMWASSQLEVGGPTSQKNDTLLDGMPAQAGPKGTYAPSMDAVTEVSVQQNSVDAEYGHSAGGILNVSMKSGTNNVKGRPTSATTLNQRRVQRDYARAEPGPQPHFQRRCRHP